MHYCSYGDFRLIKKIYDLDPSFTKIYDLHSDEVQSFFKLTGKQSAIMKQNMNRFSIEQISESLEVKKINVTTIFDKEYPSLLKQIYDPPWVLYCKGNLSLLAHPMLLSVVGTRHPTKYAYDELKILLPPLIEKNITIVSGLAIGIDQYAHEITLNALGKTIAVCAFGFDHIYPRSNATLFHTLSDSQLVLSEYPPFVKAKKWHFPERNRIISGLSLSTLIVEAKERSGSLITADTALQQNRDVFALPGRLSQEESLGTNHLIQQGAKLILSADNILEEYF